MDRLTLALGVCERLISLRTPRRCPDGNSDVEEEKADEEELEDYIAGTHDETYDETHDETHEETRNLEVELDQYIFNFCTALLYHRIKETYNSAIISFYAVRYAIIDP